MPCNVKVVGFPKIRCTVLGLLVVITVHSGSIWGSRIQETIIFLTLTCVGLSEGVGLYSVKILGLGCCAALSPTYFWLP